MAIGWKALAGAGLASLVPGAALAAGDKDLGGGRIGLLRRRQGARTGPFGRHALDQPGGGGDAARARAGTAQHLRQRAIHRVPALHGTDVDPRKAGLAQADAAAGLAAEREHRGIETAGGHRDGMALVLRQRRRRGQREQRRAREQRQTEAGNVLHMGNPPQVHS